MSKYFYLCTIVMQKVSYFITSPIFGMITSDVFSETAATLKISFLMIITSTFVAKILNMVWFQTQLVKAQAFVLQQVCSLFNSKFKTGQNLVSTCISLVFLPQLVSSISNFWLTKYNISKVSLLKKNSIEYSLLPVVTMQISHLWRLALLYAAIQCRNMKINDCTNKF